MVPITTWVGGSNKDLSDGYNKDLDGSNTNLG